MKKTKPFEGETIARSVTSTVYVRPNLARADLDESTFRPENSRRLSARENLIREMVLKRGCDLATVVRATGVHPEILAEICGLTIGPEALDELRTIWAARRDILAPPRADAALANPLRRTIE